MKRRPRQKQQAADGLVARAMAPAVPESIIEAVESKPKRRGKPPLLLTPEVSKRICDSIANGLFLGQAAKLAGVSRDSIEVWRRKGGKGIEPFASFLRDYEEAELQAEAALVKVWKDAGAADFRAARELLAKRFPERWSDHAARAAVLGNEQQHVGGFHIEIFLGVPPGGWLQQGRPAQLAIAPAVEVKPVEVEQLNDEDIPTLKH